jgi:hypothetical protein
VAAVYGVADGLADEVVAYRPAAEVVAAQDLPPTLDVAVLGERPVDVEVVPPAGQFEPVEAPLAALAGKLL